MKNIKLILLFVLLSFSHAHAQAPLNITMLISDKSPFIEKKNGVITGPIYDYLEAIAADQTLKFQYIQMPFAERMKLTQSHRSYNCNYGVRKSAEREKLYKFTDHVGTTHSTVLITNMHPDSLKNYKSLAAATAAEDISIYRFKAYIYEPKTTEFIEKAGIKTFDASEARTIRMFQDHQKFGYLANYATGVHLKEQSTDVPIYMVDHFEEFSGRVDYHISCSMNTPDGTIEKLNQGIKNLGLLTLDAN